MKLTITQIKEMCGKTTIETVTFADLFAREFCGKLDDTYSLSNKSDQARLWRIFRDRVSGRGNSVVLKMLHLNSEAGLMSFLRAHVELINGLATRGSIDILPSVSHYNSNGPTDVKGVLEIYNPQASYADNPKRGRAYIVYSADDPENLELARVFWLRNGRRLGSNTRIGNLYRKDWSIKMGISYLKANSCSVKYYRTRKFNLVG